MEEQLFIYPKEGQSEQQQADDRYTCHTWAVQQTGYDPTNQEAAGKMSIDGLKEGRKRYHRAIVACLEAKNYSIK